MNRVLLLGGSLIAGCVLVGVLFWPRPAVEVVSAPPSPGTVWFEDVARASGIHFVSFDPATELNQIPETLGAGLGWIDFDNDGWLDLICVQTAPLPPRALDPQYTHKLYRNNRDGTFSDVTRESGIGVPGFGTGVAVADYDNDGYDDLVITHLSGEIRLLHNEPAPGGGRHFVDVSRSAKLADTNPHWAHAPAWGDFDGDGWLDLYVANYVEFNPQDPLVCRHEKGLTYQCSPTSFAQPHHKLYRNNGDGTFTDISESSGVAQGRKAPGLAVVVVDFDGDGRPDLFVANDLHPAYLFHNRTEPGGPIRFEEKAEVSGCAFASGGAAIAGMNAEVLDLDDTGRPSLFVTNYQSSPNVVFQNRGKLRFTEAGTASGLGPTGISRLSFGAVALDTNLSGRLDFVIVNGHVQRYAKELYGFDYAQSAQLFLQQSAGRFQDATTTAGADFLAPFVGRGLARCDFDHDGLPDVAASGIGSPTKLWKNRTETDRAWISLELIGNGKTTNRNAIGAVVQVEWAGQERTHFVVGGGSYISASDRRVHLGLGTAQQLDRVRITWPGGEQQVFENLGPRRFWRLHQGQPQAEEFTPPGR